MERNKYSPIQDWEDVVDTDFPDFEVTGESREMCKKYGQTGKFRMDVRYAQGRIWTDEELENYRLRVLARPLP